MLQKGRSRRWWE
ncbi:hypothetical protein CRE_04563 [Caenorhabditis remanei]|uniref:Uncharacterized protein n=1 Tax=Caenorhabditis remanei TaxID=31234 RepID=E3LZ38_CAERE|nr:hypothetical protein CRE_04563 [Caenorhabditis remanei]